ncbi:sensor histidine kinase [Litchfieldella anticariensis]|nr:ATP-binding protein [Halomonas anticariensis]
MSHISQMTSKVYGVFAALSGPVVLGGLWLWLGIWGALVSGLAMLVGWGWWYIRQATCRARCAERVCEDMERQLHEMQRMAALGQVSGGVVHDFNNLLTVIIGNAELLLESIESGSALRQPVELMLHAGERGRLQTQRLLSFARHEPLTPSHVDVNTLLRAGYKFLEASLGTQVTVRMRLTPLRWMAYVDPAQLESTIINLAVNARDAMPEGGEVTIATSSMIIDEASIGWAQDLEPGHYVRITISDTGLGMTHEVRQQAFEPFFTTKRRGKGTGLGLSMALGFAKRSGGHVSLSSEPEGGTTVHLYLPCGGTRGEKKQPSGHRHWALEPMAGEEAGR